MVGTWQETALFIVEQVRQGNMSAFKSGLIPILYLSLEGSGFLNYL